MVRAQQIEESAQSARGISSHYPMTLRLPTAIILGCVMRFAVGSYAHLLSKASNSVTLPYPPPGKAQDAGVCQRVISFTAKPIGVVRRRGFFITTGKCAALIARRISPAPGTSSPFVLLVFHGLLAHGKYHLGLRSVAPAPPLRAGSDKADPCFGPDAGHFQRRKAKNCCGEREKPTARTPAQTPLATACQAGY